MIDDERTLSVGSAQSVDRQDRFDAQEPRKGTSIGRYIILKLIGRGAMGTVFSAFDPRLDRRVAVKLLRDQSRDDAAVARLLREAQTLARLSHPNVVTVFDVGEHLGQVFVAMELVDGVTLRTWSSQPQRWQDVVEVYRQAAFGLAAAHAQEIIHRDFKPDNVMIGHSTEGQRLGRVRVMDFGLAHSDSTATAVAEDDGLTTSLTKTGAIMGTPAYMSPEQFAGQVITPASDQFSWSVALYEALVGERPFEGATLHELAVAVKSGTPRPPKRGAPIPSRVLAVVRKGFSVRPEDRHASMAAVADALSRSSGRNRVALAGVALVGAAALASTFLMQGDQSAPCNSKIDEIRAVWSADRIAGLEERFEATGRSTASTSWHQAKRPLDAFVQEWSETYGNVCGAWASLDTELVARRENCLQTQREQFEEVVEVLDNADPKTVGYATAGASGLPRPKDCAEDETLVELPRPDWRPGFESAQRFLARARARRTLGDPAGARALLVDAEASIEGLGLPRMRANILLERANLLLDSAPREELLACLHEALRQAARGGDDNLLANIWLSRIRMGGYSTTADLAEKEHLLLAAEIAVARAGGRKSQVGAIRAVQGSLALHRGELDQSEALLLEALEKGEGSETAAGYRASYLDVLGQVYAAKGDPKRANELMRKALEAIVDAYGEAYPPSLTHRGNVGVSCLALHDYACAREQFEIVEKMLDEMGDDSTDRALNGTRLGQLEYVSGNYERAEVLASSALASFALHKLERSRLAAPVVALRIDLARKRGDLDAALERARDYQVITESAYPAGHSDHFDGLDKVANILKDANRLTEAQAAFEEVLAKREAILGPDHPDIGYALLPLAEIALLRGAPEIGLPLAERGRRILEAADANTDVRNAAAVLLVLLLADRDPDRARALALETVAKFDSTTPAELRQQLEAWLEARKLAPGLAVREHAP